MLNVTESSEHDMYNLSVQFITTSRENTHVVCLTFCMNIKLTWIYGNKYSGVILFAIGMRYKHIWFYKLSDFF